MKFVYEHPNYYFEKSISDLTHFWQITWSVSVQMNTATADKHRGSEETDVFSKLITTLTNFLGFN